MGGEGRGASDYFRICQLSHSSAYPASLPASLLLPVLGSVNNDKCRTSDADRSTLEVFHNCFSFILLYLRQKFSNRCLARNQTISKLKLDKNDQLNLADQSLNIDVDISKNVKLNFPSKVWFNIVLALLQRSSGRKK